MSRPLRRRGVRVIENGFVDLCVLCLYNNVTNFFAVRRVRDLETACALVLFIPTEVSDIYPGPVSAVWLYSAIRSGKRCRIA